MSWHLEREAARLADRLEHGDRFWPAQLTVATAIALNLLLTERVTVGPTWLMPSVEGVLLVALIAIVPTRAVSHSRGRRRFALAVIGLVSATNVASLGLLVHFLINGGKAGGHPLITSGVVLWATNVLLFAVWYWELDGGGPVTRHLNPESLRDFEFPQMDNPKVAPPGWRPGYLDYLYVSVTNASAFSPTDTMPLTHTAKVVMTIQSITALTTIGLVVARAVNVLA
jgi:uncharacterized membrane protein